MTPEREAEIRAWRSRVEGAQSPYPHRDDVDTLLAALDAERDEVMTHEFTLHELVVAAHAVVTAQYPGETEGRLTLPVAVSCLSGHLMDMGDLGDPERYPRLVASRQNPRRPPSPAHDQT
jgi:hypothetical protein